MDDPGYVFVEFDFDTAGAAETFLQFLTNQVWASQAYAPGLAGAPRTAILEVASADLGPD